MGVERELKLEGDPADLRRLLQEPMIAAGMQGKPKHKQLVTTYYDTEDCWLREACGISLRVRRDGRRWLQTVKRERRSEGVLFARDEWEMPIASELPDPALLTDPELADVVSAITARGVVPIVRSEIRRDVADLRWTDEHGRTGVVNLALDEGTIHAGGRQAAVGELELELVEGDPACLFSLALRCADLVPVRFGTLAKWERGFRLHAGLPPRPEKAERPVITPDSNIEEVMIASIAAAMRQWLGNEAAVQHGGDPEGVHQMRVALRRLRSLLTLFKDLIPEAQRRSLSAELREIVQALGAARDLDVFETELLRPVAEARPQDPAPAALRSLVEQARVAAYAKAHAKVGERSYARAVLRLSAWLDMRGWRTGFDSSSADQLAMPAAEAAASILEKALRKVLRQGRGFAELSPPERHEVRIALKKLRYGADAFAGLFDEDRVKPYLRRLSRLQDHMGRFNDAAVAGATADSLLSDPGLRAADPALAARGGGLVVGWHGHAALADEPELVAAWRAFKNAEPFWRSEE
ncbi:MAG TPA: CYTH and CHAD domain-containing protein [Geminicoccus sp.]|jgi:inorganic triphosphatase YgiF|uniref:CYTH and CHAD domain-containing protein n=1 Tax=Geminicoccus sp. TaxID=2024832 RepID=UPI002E2ED305|nr:CYTH and CHAD domain-containing protein [Geminicoccus sp.]HEX2527040.1 CYTH and CHAD domain-containing protein [Geminicoccus sp.]